MLRHPAHDVAVSLSDCDELAADEGLPDRWAVAERYAAAMLPGVFLPEDPVLALEVAPEHTHRLQTLLLELDTEIFHASDSLGWTYQFWRGSEKDAVNKSGVKIGADELPAVTQLFTENYMVRFLLHNTLGAWWAGKILAQRPELAKTAPDEATLRAACALPKISWDMLRFVRENDVWRPAAGTFPGWPQDARSVTLLDPCCGSGHFLTEALPILASLRQAEEGLSASDATAAVLKDNLFGLEIDGRCVQIAAFAVALTSWAFGGWQSLPRPHIAWVGAPPPLPKQEFIAMANGDADMRAGLAALHDLFSQAPILGSLIEPTGGDLMSPQRLGKIEPLLDKLLIKARKAEPETMEGAIAARGMADAAHILSNRFTLIATNVPFLGKGKQCSVLYEFCEKYYEAERADLSTTMIERLIRFAFCGGTVAAVSPQNWLFLGSYADMRRHLLSRCQINVVCDLGPAAFNEMNWWAARTALFCCTNKHPSDDSLYLAIDADTGRDLAIKPKHLTTTAIAQITQINQFKNPECRITVQEIRRGTLLSSAAKSYQGIKTGDDNHFRRYIWECNNNNSWTYFQSTVLEPKMYGGRDSVVFWKDEGEQLARRQGMSALGFSGVAISQMRELPNTIFSGDLFDSNVAPIIPSDENDIDCIYAFCSSDEYRDLVRAIDKKVAVANATFVKVPFDKEYWKKVAAEKYPNGLPEPYSDDPTQWLFHGHPAQAETGTALHVALARLAGYRWPAETDTKMRLSAEARAWIAKAATLPEADDDGILCVPAVAGERALADRLRAYLAAAFGVDWSDAKERKLIAETDAKFEKKAVKDQTLEGWLRDRAFRQHCSLFHDRPFLWQVWDGMKDGFSVFLHYHRFNQATLRKLTYTTMGDWLTRAKAEGSVPRQEKGRELQQTMEKILEGEKPYDIFVRWKSLAEQPLGWDPDLDDGVRMNIRPFMTAEILRDKPNIKWTKDRGTDIASAPWYNLHSGERINDHHTSLAEKRAARGKRS